MKDRRYIAASFVMLVVIFAALLIAPNVDRLLTGENLTPQLAVLANQLLTSAKALIFFLMLVAAGGLFVFWALYGRTYLNYRSDMYEVVPGLSIPMPYGQGQYGTAWWLDKESYDTVFSSVETPDHIPLSDDLKAKYDAERRTAPSVQI